MENPGKEELHIGQPFDIRIYYGDMGEYGEYAALVALVGGLVQAVLIKCDNTVKIRLDQAQNNRIQIRILLSGIFDR